MTIDIEDFTEICHSLTSAEPELQRKEIFGELRNIFYVVVS